MKHNLLELRGIKTAAISAVLIGVAMVLRQSAVTLPTDALQDILTLSLGILYEALPFVFLGIFLSVAVQYYGTTTLLYKVLPANGIVRRAFLSIFGVFLPVCECGNVPLARGLITKGLRPQDVLTFLFAAPIINPITIFTTLQAFPAQPEIAVLRVAGALLIANAIGALFHRVTSEKLLTQEFRTQCDVAHNDQPKKKFALLVASFQEETLRLMPALVTGSLVAGVVQTAVPRSLLTTISSQPVLAIAAMIGLAFIVSICANVDAFFALSLSGIFPVSALLAFLLFGPMIDIKMLALLRTTFRPWVLAIITAFVLLSTMALSLGVHYAL